MLADAYPRSATKGEVGILVSRWLPEPVWNELIRISPIVGMPMHHIWAKDDSIMRLYFIVVEEIASNSFAGKDPDRSKHSQRLTYYILNIKAFSSIPWIPDSPDMLRKFGFK